MAADRWDPCGEMGALRERVNRVFDEMFGPPERGAWAPPVDILERAEAIVFRADIAGVKLEDLNIELEGDTLTFSGERRAEDAAYLRRERPQGPLRRSFTLGVPVDAAGVKATYRDGMLEIILPKSRETRAGPVKVPVE
jgi:HSP20 family protein